MSATPARLLALDAATDTLYLAVQAPDGVRGRAVPGGAQASAALLPQIASLLAEVGWTVADLDALAYGQGPGAFTGLRTACSVAQGLALGAGKPVLALDTLAAVAECARRQGAGDTVWAMQDARMGEVYAALFQRHGDGWRAVVPAALYRPETLAERAATPGAAWAGNALLAYAALQRVGVPAWPAAVPDGAALMTLAQQAWREGGRRDPADALPVYVREKVAMTTAERSAARLT